MVEEIKGWWFTRTTHQMERSDASPFRGKKRSMWRREEKERGNSNPAKERWGALAHQNLPDQAHKPVFNFFQTKKEPQQLHSPSTRKRQMQMQCRWTDSKAKRQSVGRFIEWKGGIPEDKEYKKGEWKKERRREVARRRKASATWNEKQKKRCHLHSSNSFFFSGYILVKVVAMIVLDRQEEEGERRSRREVVEGRMSTCLVTANWPWPSSFLFVSFLWQLQGERLCLGLFRMSPGPLLMCGTHRCCSF